MKANIGSWDEGKHTQLRGYRLLFFLYSPKIQVFIQKKNLSATGFPQHSEMSRY